MESLGYLAVGAVVEVQFIGPIAVENMRTEIDVVEIIILIVELLEHTIEEVDQGSYQVSPLLGFDDILSH